MSNQYVEGVQKWKKVYLKKEGKITMWFYLSHAELETRSLLFQEQRQREVQNGFLGLSSDTRMDMPIL